MSKSAAQVRTMDADRRSRQNQSHLYMMALLNDEQKEVVVQYEMFDWHLIFVRQPVGHSVVPFLKNNDTGRFAILEPDGSLNEEHDQIVR